MQRAVPGSARRAKAAQSQQRTPDSGSTCQAKADGHLAACSDMMNNSPQAQALAQLQQDVQGSLRVAQLYRNLGEGPVYGYGKGTGGNVPTFEFQQFSATRDYDAIASTTTYGVEAAQVVEDTPNLRVSDNNDLAVPASGGAESKQFFATPAKIRESNNLLHNSGAPLRLTQGGGQVKLPAGWNPFGPTLQQVAPDFTQVQNNSSECGAFAANILGTPVDTGELTTVGGPQAVPGVGNPMGARPDAIINNALAGQPPEQVGGNEAADPEVGESFGIYARTPPPPVLGLLAGMRAVRDKLLETIPYLKWGEHWAGVVAKSGGDYVTMENYNRNVSSTAIVEEAIENDYKELRGLSDVNQYVARTAAYAAQGAENRAQRLNRLRKNYLKYAVQIGQVQGHYSVATGNWYFAMYGRGAQSFHAAWKNALPNSVTLKTHSSDAGLQAHLVAKLNALVPHDQYSAGVQATLQQHILNVQNAVGRNAILAAFVTGEKQVCLERLDSAHTYLHARRKRSRRVAVNEARQKARARVNSAVGDAIAPACNAGITAMEQT